MLGGGDGGYVYVYGDSYVNYVRATGGDGDHKIVADILDTGVSVGVDEGGAWQTGTQRNGGSSPSFPRGPAKCADKGGNGGKVLIETQGIDLTAGGINVDRGMQGQGGLNCADGAIGEITLNHTEGFTDVDGLYEGEMYLTIINNSAYGGSIEWLNVIDSDTEIVEDIVKELSVNTNISFNHVYANGDLFDEALDTTALVTLHGSPGQGLPPFRVLRDGYTCLDCYNFTLLTDPTVEFNVTGFSNYSIGTHRDPFGIVLSPLLEQIVEWVFGTTGVNNQHAIGNNDVAGVTEYNVSVFAAPTVLVDVYMWASGDLIGEVGTPADGFVIGLGNETYDFSLTQETVPFNSENDLDVTPVLLAEDLSDGDVIHLKFYGDVPLGQRDGVYSNLIHFEPTLADAGAP